MINFSRPVSKAASMIGCRTFVADRTIKQSASLTFSAKTSGS